MWPQVELYMICHLSVCFYVSYWSFVFIFVPFPFFWSNWVCFIDPLYPFDGWLALFPCFIITLAFTEMSENVLIFTSVNMLFFRRRHLCWEVFLFLSGFSQCSSVASHLHSFQLAITQGPHLPPSLRLWLPHPLAPFSLCRWFFSWHQIIRQVPPGAC